MAAEKGNVRSELTGYQNDYSRLIWPKLQQDLGERALTYSERIKTLKNREYATRGIPFIYSEQDEDFDHQSYVLKAPADESPINICDIIDFVDSQSWNPMVIRHSVDHLSWKVQMQKVVESVFPTHQLKD